MTVLYHSLILSMNYRDRGRGHSHDHYWEYIDTKNPQRIAAGPVFRLAASARLGLVVAPTKPWSNEATVYALDDTVDGGVEPRFTFTSSANIHDLAFTDSPKATEPPLLIVALIRRAELDIVDVSGPSAVSIGRIRMKSTHDAFPYVRTRGRTLAIGAFGVPSVLIYEGYGRTWMFKHKLRPWGHDMLFSSRTFCIDSVSYDVVVVTTPGRLCLVGRDGSFRVSCEILADSSVRAIVPCEDGWFVLDDINIRHFPRDGRPATEMVPDALSYTAAYVPGAGIFLGGSDGIVALQDRRRFSKLRQAWCSAVVRGCDIRKYNA